MKMTNKIKFGTIKTARANALIDAVLIADTVVNNITHGYPCCNVSKGGDLLTPLSVAECIQRQLRNLK